MEEQTIHTQPIHTKSNYDKTYKLLLLIPIILLVLSLLYMGISYSNTGEFFKKDISLTGGTSVTLYEKTSPTQIQSDLSTKLDEVSTRGVYDLVTRDQKAVIIQTKTDGDATRKIVEEYLGYNLTSENSSFEFTGSVLSESFYKQLLIAILIAFLFMGIVVFLLFRTFVPSMAVIFSAFADIIMTLAVVNLLGMKLSTAGIVALLMLIGYSVDTDILLTTRLLKRQEGTVNQRIFGAFKTGMTMTLTSLFAIVFALVIVTSFSVVLTQIFSILVIGLIFDILNTWVTNVSILKWYLEHKGRKNEI